MCENDQCISKVHSSLQTPLQNKSEEVDNCGLNNTRRNNENPTVEQCKIIVFTSHAIASNF